MSGVHESVAGPLNRPEGKSAALHSAKSSSHTLVLTCCGFSCRVITIHNNPNDVELQSKYQHLKFQLPDLETENIAQFFQPTYEFIEQARAARQGESFLYVILLYQLRVEHRGRPQDVCLSSRA